MVWIVRGALVALALVATVTDIRDRTVPDWLTLPALALGLLMFGLRAGWHGLLLSQGGAGLAALVFVIPWVMGGLGGGDFKMALAIGALGGPLFSLQAMVWEMVAGLVLFAWWGARHGWRGLREPVPFATALSGGTLAAIGISIWGSQAALIALILAIGSMVVSAGWALRRTLGARVRDQSGQAIFFAVLLIMGALIIMVIGGLGLAEDMVYHSRLQTAADAASMAAAQTAEAQVTIAASYYTQACVVQHFLNTTTWTWFSNTTCTNSGSRTVDVSGSSSSLFASETGMDGQQMPVWAADAGCDAYGQGPVNQNATVCTRYGIVGPVSWSFPHPNTAENDAVSILETQFPGAVLTGFQLLSGKVYLSATYAETKNIAKSLLGKISTSVQSVGTPIAVDHTF